jgi:hypothetical protein
MSGEAENPSPRLVAMARPVSIALMAAAMLVTMVGLPRLRKPRQHAPTVN